MTLGRGAILSEANLSGPPPRATYLRVEIETINIYTIGP